MHTFWKRVSLKSWLFPKKKLAGLWVLVEATIIKGVIHTTTRTGTPMRKVYLTIKFK